MAGRGGRGRGDFLIRRGGRRLGDVRPTEEDRTQETTANGMTTAHKSDDVKTEGVHRLHSGTISGLSSRRGLGDVRNVEDDRALTNVFPPSMATTPPVMGVNTLGSCSVPESREHTVASGSLGIGRPGNVSESSVTPSLTTQGGSSTGAAGSTNRRGPYRGISLEKSNK